MNFIQNVEQRNWEYEAPFGEAHAHFLGGEGADIRPQIRPRKIPDLWFYQSMHHQPIWKGTAGL